MALFICVISEFLKCQFSSPFRILILLPGILVANLLIAQPANDNCNNAAEILITNGGFGIGTFTSAQSNMTQATVQNGENHAPALVTSGLNRRSVWYRFSIPTTRSVKVTLSQPGGTLPAGSVGFTIYRARNCLPSLDSLSTKLTPLETIGNTLHPCVEAGDYLIQVGGNNNANGTVAIVLELARANPALYDAANQPHEFGRLNDLRMVAIEYGVDCQSIDQAGEVCLPNTSFRNYNKSTWHTFTTPNYFDYLSFVTSIVNSDGNTNEKFGYRIFEGNVKTAGIGGISQIGGCDSLTNVGYYFQWKHYKCGALKPNTVYSVQLLFHRDFKADIRVGINWDGYRASNGPLPVTSISAKNRLGNLTPTVTESNYTVSDTFACNSRHIANTCKIMPTGFVSPLNGFTYNLSNFYSFELTRPSDLGFGTTTDVCNHATHIRLYRADLAANCAAFNENNIIGNWLHGGNISCLPAGRYVFQIMGIDSLVDNLNFNWSQIAESTDPHCFFYHLGRPTTLHINVKPQTAIQQFDLSAAGRIDRINANASNVMQPLQPRVVYESKKDVYGCNNTVLPGPRIPGDNLTKAIFRTFQVADSGMLIYHHLSHFSKLYQGDANALAVAQNRFSWGDTLRNMRPHNLAYYTGWPTFYEYRYQNACLVPGPYTIASFGNSTYNGQENDIKIEFNNVRTRFHNAGTAERMGNLWDSAAKYGTNVITTAEDTFTCRDNPATIDGVAPHEFGEGPATKLIYREFYLSKASRVDITDLYHNQNDLYFNAVHTIFRGRASQGINSLKKISDSYTFFHNLSMSNGCESLAEGWYTLVSYGWGPSYTDVLRNRDDEDIRWTPIGLPNKLTLSISEGFAAPLFNRPFKAAYDAGTNKPIRIDYTNRFETTTIQLPMDRYDCNTDLPWSGHPSEPCSPGPQRVSYYVVELTQPSYVEVHAPGEQVKMWRGDVRKDSSRVLGARLVSNCEEGFSPARGCRLTPGIYTIAVYVSDRYVGRSFQPYVLVSSGARYYQPHLAAIDTITRQPFLVDYPHPSGAEYYSLYPEFFDCGIDTPFAGGKLQACVPELTKTAYYVFRITKPSYVQVQLDEGNTAATALVFPFDVRTDSNKLNTVKPLISCEISQTSLDLCNLAPGVYTLVFMVPNDFTSRTVVPRLYVEHRGRYNRPHKAAIDTITKQPFLFDYADGPNHSAALPHQMQRFSLHEERFDCHTDTPWLSRMTTPCVATSAQVSFYVFRVTRPIYTEIYTGNLWAQVFDFDVRKDSNLLKTKAPIQPCNVSNGHIMLCNLQPGVYTLVVYATPAQHGAQFTPSVYVDAMRNSRFDHAMNAYDFGTVPGDTVWYGGKKGDVNPLNAGRSPSNDFISCNTGAQSGDPIDNVCSQVLTPSIYRKEVNNYLYKGSVYDSTGHWQIPRRNLWYTFVVDEPGQVEVKVESKSIELFKNFQPTFSIYKSDVDGSIPWNTIRSTGQVDSTLAQGLEFVVNNPSNFACYSREGTINFYREPCDPANHKATRYYILVDNTNVFYATWWGGVFHDPPGAKPNVQIEVSVKLSRDTATFTKYDHYSNAMDMGRVNSGYKKGITDNLICATRDITDPIVDLPACNRTLWYKFTTQTTGFIRYNAVYAGATEGTSYGPEMIRLFQQVVPGDSTERGLQYLPATQAYYDPITERHFGERCISPGTYYFLLPGCDLLNHVIFPEMYIVQQEGDFCSAPRTLRISGAGNANGSLLVNCHTIGTDYGEFNPTLTCPPGMNTQLFKTSWFRLDIAGRDTLDLTIFIDEQTNASGDQIKYRMMTGTCNAMQEQSCVLDARTRNTYKCLAPGNSYYVQVFTPVSLWVGGPEVTGSITLNAQAVKYRDTCQPINNCIAVANFTTQFDCRVDQGVRFINQSTFGSDIRYEWDFGVNGAKSNEVAPRFVFPAATTARTYTIKLKVTNVACGRVDSVASNITIPARPTVNLGPDTSVCTTGASLTLRATSHNGTTYAWNTGATTATLRVDQSGTYTVEARFGSCIARDTIEVWFSPLEKKKPETRVFCNTNELTLDASRGFGEIYRWNNNETSPTITVRRAGIYWVDLLLNGCVVRDTFIVINQEGSILGQDTTICQRNLPFRIQPNIANATSYQWQNGSTQTFFNATRAGLYWLEVSVGGCTLRDSIVVNVDSFRTVNLTTRICGGNTYRLPSGRNVSIAGNYQDTVRNRRGCDSLITRLTLVEDTVVRTVKTVSICEGQSFALPSGRLVSAAGFYADTMRYRLSGCDSAIAGITVLVTNVNRRNSNITICSGASHGLPSGRRVSIAGIYQDTLKSLAGCDSIIFLVNLSVDGFTTLNNSVSICEGSSYTFPTGKRVSTAGLHRDTLRNIRGCDSVRISTQVTILSPVRNNRTITLCAGQTFTLPGGRIVSTAGTYADTVRSSQGCDSLISSTQIIVQGATSVTLRPRICAGTFYTTPSGKQLRVSGTYADTLRYVSGCDSVRYSIVLGVDTLYRDNKSVSLCFGSTYTLPGGRVVSRSGVYVDTVKYASGCDSLISEINLSIGEAIISNRTITLCAGQTFTLPGGRIVSTAGTYADTVRSSQGCDSLISSTQIIVQGATTVILRPRICAGTFYTTPSGKQLRVSGTYADTLRYVSGCDSVRYSIVLGVDTLYRDNKSVSLCFGSTYTLPGGRVVSRSGVYVDTVKYASGCDSLISEINLSIGEAIISNRIITLCVGQTFTLPGGRVVSTAGTYADTVRSSQGCDSLISSTQIIVQAATSVTLRPRICAGIFYTTPSGKRLAISGTYADTLRYVSGCDSVRYSIVLRVDTLYRENKSVSLCFGSTYTLPGGRVVSRSGVYVDTVRYASGCDSLISEINLSIGEAIISNRTITLCVGQTFTLPGGRIVSTAGTYADTVRSSQGCDSLISSTQIIVQAATSVTLRPRICAGIFYTTPSGKRLAISGTYADTLRYVSGCDSVRYSIVLSVDTLYRENKSVSLCFGSTYTLPGGRVVSRSGVYVDTVKYASGCDSLISEINLSIGEAIISNRTITLCAGQTFTLPGGRIVSTAGTYADTVRSSQGCDSLISSTQIIVQAATTVTLRPRICAGTFYTTPSGKQLRVSGTYADTLRYVSGCDSVRYSIVLGVDTLYRDNKSVSLCFGSTYTLPGGRVVSRSGVYVDTVRYASGCDSLITEVNLSIGEAIISNRTITLCAGQTFTLPGGRVVSTAGTYADTVRSSQGCDSLISSTQIIVQAATSVTSRPRICAGTFYTTPSGKQLRVSGTYADTLHYVSGCDSMRYSIVLVVAPLIRQMWDSTICLGKSVRLPSGRVVVNAGTYIDTVKYALGCDSLITQLQLRVIDAVRNSISPSICLGASYTMPSGQQVNVAGLYQDTVRSSTGCDSLITSINLRVDTPISILLEPVICFNTTYTSPSGKRWIATGNYRDTLRNTRGCDSMHYNIRLVVRSLRQSQLIDTICTGQRKQLAGGRIVERAGTYVDTLRASDGCDSIVTTQLFVRAPLEVTITGRSRICLGDTTRLVATASGGTGGPYTITWQGATGSGFSVVVQPTTPQNIVSVRASDGCTTTDATATFTITTEAAPVPGLSNATVTICRGASTSLQARGGVQYLWSPASSLSNATIANPVATPDTDTRYIVQVRSALGCMATDSILVKVTQPFTMEVSRDTFVCTGGSIRLEANGAVSYTWTGGNIQSTQNTITVQPASNTIYTVVGRGVDACFEQRRNITVRVIPLPTVISGNDTTIMAGTNFVLRPRYGSGIVNYRWSPAQYLSCTDCPSPTTAPREPITYTVRVQNAFGCVSEDSRKIDLICNNSSIFLPNTFTPNGDGMNDIWYPRGGGIKQVKWLRVYNRWGNLIYERTNFNADDRSAGWDGSYKGQKLPPDVFVYSLGSICDNGQVIETRGNVMIVR